MDTRRVENARLMVWVIHPRTLRICHEACLLDEKREHYRAREETCEVAGRELAAAIEQVQQDLASLQNP